MAGTRAASVRRGQAVRCGGLDAQCAASTHTAPLCSFFELALGPLSSVKGSFEAVILCAILITLASSARSLTRIATPLPPKLKDVPKRSD